MTTRTVSNAAELQSALSSSAGGDTILLAAGNYGYVPIDGKNYSGTVTLKSLSDAAPAHIDKMVFYHSSNITLAGLEIGSQLGTDQPYASNASLQVLFSSGITVVGSKIQGSDDGKYDDERVGMYIFSSNKVNVFGSDFNNLGCGLIATRSSLVSVSGNQFHKIKVDATQFSQVENVIISKNLIYDGYKDALDHADGIQFFTAGTDAPSKNITIYGNEIYQGAGRGMQGIFIGDETDRMPFENIRIYSNIIYESSEWNGIAIFGAKNLYVGNNTVVSPQDDSKSMWIRLEDVQSGLIEGNLTESFILARNGSDLKFSGNVDFKTSPDAVSVVPNINAGAAANASDLTAPWIGYRVDSPVAHAVGRSIYDLVRSPSKTGAVAAVHMASDDWVGTSPAPVRTNQPTGADASLSQHHFGMSLSPSSDQGFNVHAHYGCHFDQFVALP
jgi:hypothetical protein